MKYLVTFNWSQEDQQNILVTASDCAEATRKVQARFSPIFMTSCRHVDKEIH